MRNFARFWKNDDGAAMVEYGLLVGLIAVVCIVGVTTLGTNVEDLFCYVSGQLVANLPAGTGVAACP
jgi:pilus assembly protein Flp/PilA